MFPSCLVGGAQGNLNGVLPVEASGVSGSETPLAFFVVVERKSTVFQNPIVLSHNPMAFAGLGSMVL